ncbi:hypothetical protein J7K93_03255 [bacterium]|nr:hypothetical protein [bacterium]
MKKIIIGIHGLKNKPSVQILEQWWKDSIIEGLEWNKKRKLKQIPFYLVYWADILHKEPLDAFETDPAHHLFLAEPYVPSLRIGFNNDEHENISNKIVELFETQFAKVFLNSDLTINFSDITDILIKHLFKDLNVYYSPESADDNGVREKIQNRLFDVLYKNRKKKIMLIAHSMGSIIAYDVLFKKQDILNIDTFVTIGSPLGIPVIMEKIKKEHRLRNSVKTLPIPESIKGQWINLYDPEDKIPLKYTLASKYRKNKSGVKVKDQLVYNDYVFKNRENHHKSFGYLRTSKISDLILQFLRRENFFVKLIKGLGKLHN